MRVLIYNQVHTIGLHKSHISSFSHYFSWSHHILATRLFLFAYQILITYICAFDDIIMAHKWLFYGVTGCVTGYHST